uniref:Carboxylic ester hydrolase n=1 Tax=Lygus hesperus TaxID=30085 RepID=A0A0A9YTA4_LYGHE
MFFLVAALCLQAAADERLPEVTIGQGTVRGLVQKTINGREFEAFLGIPYANPPVGQQRFKAAEPKESWNGVWNATVPPNQCMQISYFTNEIEGSEDCLYVNVYTPQSNSKKALDVLVYIHGGGFQFLTGTAYGPEYILDRDVVYVTFNYRLGTLGFLSFEDDQLPGNNGLKDQNLALKWVNKNIAAFGGDPKKITISGMSAGGASVHYHLLSKKSKGLFAKAIMTSGSVSNPWAVSKNVGEKSFRLAAELGCLGTKTSKILECLRERPAERIVRLSDLSRVEVYNPISPIGPMIEKPSRSAFIDKQPYDIIRNGEAYDVPIMWSVNSDEGLFPGAKIIADESGALDKNWDTIIPHLLELNFTASSKQQLQIAHQLREHYLGGKRIRDAPGKFTELLGDRYFYNGIHEAAKLHAENSKSPVWFYRFSYVSDTRLSDYYKISDIYKGGACHGDDCHYVLRAVYAPVEGHPEDKKMISTMVDIWLNFMQSSVPSSWKTVKSGLPDLTFLDIVCSDPKNNVVKTEGRTPGQELWLSFNLPENSGDLIKDNVHTEL